MTTRLLIVLLSLASAGAGPAAPLPTADELLAGSLAYHDPQDTWASRAIVISSEVRLAERLAESRGYSVRTDRVRIDNANGRFALRSERAGNVVEIEGPVDDLAARLNGSPEISDADRETHRLGDGQLTLWRDYFSYMFGLPMKLRDPGTRLDPTVERVEFNDREALALRVTYSPEVGKDIWYFYFDPETFALVGCRFYHDEAANDGEYLTFDGEVRGPHGLRLPRTRHWHMNVDGEWIADDVIVAIE